ncbi:sialate O-acetylesterase [Rubripirellula sp.]|nr:sialate O-acetylesterase [Rubripirellula sp.]MDB4634291.1 sialate O-acetylesterase [Rubripirellula sp.]MDB4654049.1 sialate O-acetylesterase [bacterium]MDC0288396.1 sialate O-acetylesterase [Rubripirellula sp.]
MLLKNHFAPSESPFSAFMPCVICFLLIVVSADAVAEKPVKVFVLAGQSNMDGQADIRTLDFLGEDSNPDRASLLGIFKSDAGALMTRDDVWVANAGVYDKLQAGFGGRRNYDKLGSKIGPEYAFGYYMGEVFDEQVLLIKYAPGGKSLHVDFRPPSAGNTGNEKLDTKVLTKEVAEKWNGGKVEPVVGLEYRKLVRYVEATLSALNERFPDYEPTHGYEIAGLVWFQGFNDMFDVTGRQQYGKNLKHLIHDLRRDLRAPEMKVVVGVMGVNGPENEENPKQRDVRNGQRSINNLPGFKGNAQAIETAGFCHPQIVAIKTAGWLNKKRDLKAMPLTEQEQEMLARATSDKGYHYYGEGRFFVLVGKAFAETMLKLLGENESVEGR